MSHFNITVAVQNHQLNHLPPADFLKICTFSSSEFCQNYTGKTSPTSLTVFLTVKRAVESCESCVIPVGARIERFLVVDHR